MSAAAGSTSPAGALEPRQPPVWSPWGTLWLLLAAEGMLWLLWFVARDPAGVLTLVQLIILSGSAGLIIIPGVLQWWKADLGGLTSSYNKFVCIGVGWVHIAVAIWRLITLPSYGLAENQPLAAWWAGEPRILAILSVVLVFAASLLCFGMLVAIRVDFIRAKVKAE